jgi:YD repeat-containing protein
VKTCAYDAFGKLISEAHADGTTTQFSYDADGRLLSATSASGRIAYEYDRAGRLSKVTDEAVKEVIEYEYDTSGLKTAMRRGGATVHYGYGKNRELLSVKEDGRPRDQPYVRKRPEDRDLLRRSRPSVGDPRDATVERQDRAGAWLRL